MLDLSLIDLLRDAPRSGVRKAGDPGAERALRSAPPRSADGGSAVENADGDRVEISGHGHHLQVEARVREAVVSELRRLAGEPPVPADGGA